VVRPYVAADRAAVEAVLDAAYAEYPVLREISSVHAEERGTLVADAGGDVVAVATLRHSDRHPTHVFLAGAVHPERRRRGIGQSLLGALPGDGRPSIARVRDLDDDGGCFLRARGFGLVMRNVTVVVEPQEQRPAVELVDPTSLEVLARAHEAAYARQHETWMPVTERPLEESLRLFCGKTLINAVLAERGVASLHEWKADELALIAGAEDERTARSLVAWARSHGRPISIEADEADAVLWRLAHELPHVREETLFLLSTDATLHAGA
jgi:N-acetylglutamate synthase-like GNAT family acetyltransferase